MNRLQKAHQQAMELRVVRKQGTPVDNTIGVWSDGKLKSDESIYINSSGNVGIGTTSPGNALHIVDNISGTSVKIDNTHASYSNSDPVLYVKQSGDTSHSNSVGIFGVGNSDDTGNDGNLLRITQSGRVGIGETTPDAPLEVSTTPSVGTQAVTIDQNDEDKPFIDYQGTARADATASISTHGTPGALQGWIQIEINGVKRWIPFYSDPSA